MCIGGGDGSLGDAISHIGLVGQHELIVLLAVDTWCRGGIIGAEHHIAERLRGGVYSLQGQAEGALLDERQGGAFLDELLCGGGQAGHSHEKRNDE